MNELLVARVAKAQRVALSREAAGSEIQPYRSDLIDRSWYAIPGRQLIVLRHEHSLVETVSQASPMTPVHQKPNGDRSQTLTIEFENEDDF